MASDITEATGSRHTLALASLAHALHDGFTDMIYVLLPVWQAEFSLDYVALAVLRAINVGVLAALQVPSAHLAKRLNARTVLALGDFAQRNWLCSGRFLGRSRRIVLLSRVGRCWRQHSASTCFLRCVACLWRQDARSTRHLQFRGRSRQSDASAAHFSIADRNALALDTMGGCWPGLAGCRISPLVDATSSGPADRTAKHRST